MNKRPFWIFALALSPLACGSVVVPGDGSETSLCPVKQPEGGNCDAPDGLRCTYGAQVRPECRREWTCSDGQWATPLSVCLSPPADHCAFTEPPSGECMQEGDVCVVEAATICQCSACFGDGPCMVPPPVWQCSGPPMTSGCPAIVPNDGSACTSEGLECTYGNVCSASGALARCKAGKWLWETQIACPL